MSSRIRAHIRSNVVGYVALFLVLTGGTAQALTGSNTVFSDDIVNRDVKTADLGRAAVTTNRLAPNAVKTGRVANDNLTGVDIAGLTGADVTDDSLTGGDVDESSLAQVPSATSADTAGNADTVDGNSLRWIDYRSVANAPTFLSALNANGLNIRTRCVSGDLEVEATTSVDHAVIQVARGYDYQGFGPDIHSFDNDLRTNETFDILGPASTRSVNTVVFRAKGEKSVTAVFSANEGNQLLGEPVTACLVTGFATVGG